VCTRSSYRISSSRHARRYRHWPTSRHWLTIRHCLTSTLGLALALALGQSAFGLPEDADQPIHIQADNAEIDEQAERAVYRGAVQVDQGTLRVTAEEMTVELRNQKVFRIIATGTPARYTQQIEADEDRVQANANTIVYYTQEERLDLEGDAHLNQQGNTISGDLIHYDIVAGKVTATAADDGPVRMILQPASAEKEIK
jgi:lipopolysaccharide export system protein LptA